MGFEREKRLGLVGLDPEQRAARLDELCREAEQREKVQAAWLEQQENARAAGARPTVPRESVADFPARAIKNVAGTYAFAVFAAVIGACFWAFPRVSGWLGHYWAVWLIGVPAVFSPMLLGPLSYGAESRLREWYCKRHGGHVLRPFAHSDTVSVCVRCERTITKKPPPG